LLHGDLLIRQAPFTVRKKTGFAIAVSELAVEPMLLAFTG